MATAESSLRFNLFAADHTAPGIRSANSNFSSFGKGLVSKFAAAGAAIGAVSLFKGFISEAQESVRVSKLTENAIRSTGGAAKVTADQVGRLSTALSNKTGVDDEVIQSGQNLLLTFTGIRNEVGKGNNIFDQASKAALDMAAGLNGGNVTAENLKGTSIQLGKALNDPVKGITALTRSGVSFTEAQKEQIKAMVKSGDTMGAQKLILSELNREFGGAAAAAASPAQKAAVAWGNLKEQIGLGILPLFNKVADFASTTLIPAISTGVTKLGPPLRSVSKAVSVFWTALSGGSEANEFSGKLRTVNNVGIAVGAWIRNDFLPAAKQFGAWIRDVGIPAVQKLGQWLAVNLWPAVKQVAMSFRQDLLPAIQGLIAKFQEAWPTISRVLNILGQVAGFILTKVVPVLIQFYAKYLATMIQVFGQVFAAGWKIIGVLVNLGAAVGRAGAAFGQFVGTVSSAMSRAVGAVSNGISKAVSTVAGLPGRAVKAVGKLGGALYSAGSDLIQGFINGIKSKAGEVLSTIKGWITDKIPGFIKGRLGIHSPSKVTMQLGRYVSEGFAIGIKDGAPDVESAASNLVDALMAKVDEAKQFAKGIKDTFRGLGNLSGIDTMLTDPQGTQKEGGLGALLAGLKKQAADASAFAATIKRLRKAGLNEASLAGLRDAGPTSGLKAAQQLLAGGTSAIGEVNSLQASLNKTGQVFANRESRAMYGFSGNANAAMAAGGKQQVELHVNLAGGGDKFMNWLREQIRIKGGNTQLVLGKS